VDVEHLNELIKAFGDAHKAAVRAEKRGSAASPLFDLPRRSLLGWFLKGDITAGFMRDVTALMPPEEIGRRLRRLGSRPYYMQLFLLFQDVLGARQQRLLELGLREGEPYPGERLADLMLVADIWERMCRAYRTDGGLFPAADRSQQILDADALAQVDALLEPFDPETYAAGRRVLATLDAYAFLAHGEQRDGLFGHGPYPAGNGAVLFFKEVNDLQNTLLPWAQTPSRNRYANVVFAYECRDVEVICDFFGGLVTEPLDHTNRIERFVVLTNDGGVVRRVDPGEWAGIIEDASAATAEMYATVVGWDERMRTAYGSLLFANHLKPFADLVGIEANDRLAAAARVNDERYLDEVLAGPATPVSMAHWATATGDLDWPVAL
jgi:hypothetical protein